MGGRERRSLRERVAAWENVSAWDLAEIGLKKGLAMRQKSGILVSFFESGLMVLGLLSSSSPLRGERRINRATAH